MKDEYPVWQIWYRNVLWILDHTAKFPANIRITLSARIENTALDILDEVLSAIYAKEKTDILRGVNQKLDNLRIYVRLSYDRRYLSLSQFEYASREFNEFGKMIGGWIKICKG